MEKEVKTNAMRILEQNHIPYQAAAYAAGDGAIDGLSVAKKLRQDPAHVFKTLVTKGCGRDFYVFVLPVSAELNRKSAAKCVGEKAVELIPPQDLPKVTGYVRGGCSPIGMKKPLRTVVDASCLSLESMLVSGGKIGVQLALAPADLLSLLGAQTASLCE